MADRNELMHKMRAGGFRENNGRVMRTINILRHEFVRLRDVRNALTDIDRGDIKDSVNFLQQEAYIDLRHIETKASALLADAEFDDLEGRVTGKGIRLLSGSIRDPEVIV